MAYDNPYEDIGVESTENSTADKVGEAAKKAGKKVGSAAWGLGKKAAKGGARFAAGVGSASAKFTAGLGEETIKGATFGAGFAWGAMHPEYEDTSGLHGAEKFKADMRNTTRRMGDPKTPFKMAGKFFSSLVDYEPGRQVWNKTTGKLEQKLPNMKLTGRGWALALAGGAIASVMSGSQEMEKRSMGRVDATVTTATPDYQPKQYDTHLDYGGASGDLVFALWANRHG